MTSLIGRHARHINYAHRKGEIVYAGPGPHGLLVIAVLQDNGYLWHSDLVNWIVETPPGNGPYR